MTPIKSASLRPKGVMLTAMTFTWSFVHGVVNFYSVQANAPPVLSCFMPFLRCQYTLPDCRPIGLCSSSLSSASVSMESAI